MIDVVKLINTFEDLIYHFIDSDMYCICYDDGKDKRLMINYGLFLITEQYNMHNPEKGFYSYTHWNRVFRLIQTI